MQPALHSGSPEGGILACGAPSVLNRTPEDAVVSLDATVLLMKFVFSESCSETPPPSQPATLFAMMLLVTFTLYQLFGLFGKRETSAPFTACSRNPPPLPLSALFPWIRFASMFSPGPTPSLRAGGQSMSVVVPHSTATPFTIVTPSGAAPITRIPPPFVGIVGLKLWLKMTALCEISPL